MARPWAASFSTPPQCSAPPWGPGPRAPRRRRGAGGRGAGGMDADARRRAVIDGDEYRALTILDGEGRGHVGSPHRVDDLGDDRAVAAPRGPGGGRRAP